MSEILWISKIVKEAVALTCAFGGQLLGLNRKPIIWLRLSLSYFRITENYFWMNTNVLITGFYTAHNIEITRKEVRFWSEPPKYLIPETIRYVRTDP